MGTEGASTAVPSRARRPRVLVVAYHFPPEASVGTHRTLRLVRHLSDIGWDVTVLTGTERTYSSGCVIDLDLLPRVPAGVRVVRAPALRPVDRLAAIVSRVRSASSGAGPVRDAGPRVTSRTSSSRPGLKKTVEAVLRIPDHHAGGRCRADGGARPRARCHLLDGSTVDRPVDRAGAGLAFAPPVGG